MGKGWASVFLCLLSPCPGLDYWLLPGCLLLAGWPLTAVSRGSTWLHFVFAGGSGVDLGDAFSTVSVDGVPNGAAPSLLHAAVSSDGGGLFPCLSLCRDEQVEANFGQKPFVHAPPARVLVPGSGKALRRFRAVAALIPSPISLDAMPVPGSGQSECRPPPPPTTPVRGVGPVTPCGVSHFLSLCVTVWPGWCGLVGKLLAPTPTPPRTYHTGAMGLRLPASPTPGPSSACDCALLVVLVPLLVRGACFVSQALVVGPHHPRPRALQWARCGTRWRRGSVC